MVLPVLHLFVIKTFVVLRARMTQRVMIGTVSLNEHLARSISATGATRDTGAQLRRSFRGTEVGQRESRVNRDDADEGDVRKVVALRQHLRADKSINLSRTEIRQCLLEDAAARRRIAIYSGDAQGREELSEHLFELFGAFTDVVDVLLAARRTNLWHGLAVVAVVTNDNALAAMVGECYVTIRALDCLAT